MNLLKKTCPDPGNLEGCLIKLYKWVFRSGVLLQTLTNHPVPTLKSKMTSDLQALCDTRSQELPLCSVTMAHSDATTAIKCSRVIKNKTCFDNTSSAGRVSTQTFVSIQGCFWSYLWAPLQERGAERAVCEQECGKGGSLQAWRAKLPEWKSVRSFS